MISHFSLTAFVRGASDNLLTEYFQRAGSPLELPARTPKKQRAEAVVESIARLGDDERSRFESDFREVHTLATASGIRRIIDEVNYSARVRRKSARPETATGRDRRPDRAASDRR